MNILSIDVGIKHLAVCVLCVKDKMYTIDTWNVIDLCNTKKYICGCNQKNGKKCENNAKYIKNTSLYCKKHAKNSGFKIPTSELNTQKIKKFTIKKLKYLIEKYKIAFEYDKNLNKTLKKTLKMQMIDTIIEEVNIHYLDNIRKSNCNANHFNMVELGVNLKKKFNNVFDYKSIDKVAIENQIGPMAIRMKTLQGMIMQHLIENDVTNITEVSSSNKLKDFLNGKKTTYSERKKIGIEVTRNMLQEKNELNGWLEEFNKSKKKDDLADCFLQGLWYINHKLSSST
jgi:hypothetical protein